jgi:glycosyltransferase involved in cell wall biosynthesis
MMSSRKKAGRIAVVVPTHNRANLLGRALASVLAQRRPPDEVVVVDDGSTDNTAEVVARYADAVRLVQTGRAGVSSARNVGVASSGTDFVAFLDSDDFWEQDHLERMQHAIEGTEGKAWLYFSDIGLAEQFGGDTLWSQACFAIPNAFQMCSNKGWLFLPRQPILLQACVVRRDGYLAVGGSETHLVRRSDTHLIFKLGFRGAICAVAGLAGARTADDAYALTRVYPAEDVTYLRCTTWLYHDLLVRPADLTPAERAVLRRRLAEAHFDLARRSGMHSPLSMFTQLFCALKHDPRVFLSRMSGAPAALGGRLARAWDHSSGR